MSVREFKFAAKHSLKRGPVFTYWYWICRSRRIYRWRNPFQSRPVEKVSIHVLTGAEQFHMALWMLASFVHHTRRNWRIHLHDDGSLPLDASKSAGKLGLTVEHIEHRDSEGRIRAALKDYPACLRHHEAFFMARKFYGPLVFRSSDKHFVLDTDILFFSHPSELMQWVDAPDEEMWFNRDLADKSQLSAKACKEDFGFDLWSDVNAGLACIHTPSVRLEDTERFLSHRDLSDSVDQWMLEQTLYALHASQKNKGGILPPQYELSLSKSRRADAVCRHYVGAVRDRFYTEGIREAARELGVSP